MLEKPNNIEYLDNWPKLATRLVLLWQQKQPYNLNSATSSPITFNLYVAVVGQWQLFVLGLQLQLRLDSKHNVIETVIATHNNANLGSG